MFFNKMCSAEIAFGYDYTILKEEKQTKALRISEKQKG